jgi:hypothetical protein
MQSAPIIDPAMTNNDPMPGLSGNSPQQGPDHDTTISNTQDAIDPSLTDAPVPQAAGGQAASNAISDDSIANDAAAAAARAIFSLYGAQSGTYGNTVPSDAKKT